MRVFGWRHRAGLAVFFCLSPLCASISLFTLNSIGFQPLFKGWCSEMKHPFLHNEIKQTNKKIAVHLALSTFHRLGFALAHTHCTHAPCRVKNLTEKLHRRICRMFQMFHVSQRSTSKKYGIVYDNILGLRQKLVSKISSAIVCVVRDRNIKMIAGQSNNTIVKQMNNINYYVFNIVTVCHLLLLCK